MADFTSVPTVELLTRAADAAGRAAADATPGPWSQDSFYVVGLTAECRPGGEVIMQARPTRSGMASYPDHYPPNAEQRANARLAAASGPDHWRAVEAVLRTMLEIHRPWNPDASRVICKGCGIHGTSEEDRSLLALRPLAEQVLRDLGETP